MAFYVWLLSFSVFSRFTSIVTYIITSFYLLNNIPLCGYTNDIWFIHPSADGHLGCPHFRATTNSSAAMNICVRVFVWTCFQFSWVYLGVELLDHMLTLSFFEKLPNYFPKWLYHFTFPPAMYKGSNFSISLPIFIIVSFF